MQNGENIGSRIAKLRSRKNWTQVQLAEKLFVTDKAVSKWEQGRGEPGLGYVRALSDLFGVTTDYLLSGTNPPEWLGEEPAPELTALSDALTLKKITIVGDVLGRFGLFNIGQNYENTTKKTVEVFYTFPISKSASVYAFSAKIGEKIIKGVVKEKGEAKKEYQKALVTGNSAYLLERGESNVLTH